MRESDGTQSRGQARVCQHIVAVQRQQAKQAIVDLFGPEQIDRKHEASKKMARAIFEPGEQARYLRTVKEIMRMTWGELAERCGCKESDMHNWACKEKRMPAQVVGRLHILSGVIPPPFEVVPDEEYLWEAFSRGGRTNAKQLKHPPGLSALLAELVAILLGDGAVSDYRVAVSFHADAEEKYAECVAGMFRELFGLETASWAGKRHCLDVMAHSVQLVKYLTSEIGMHKGNKMELQVKVPDWILHGSEEYRRAGVRGLMDTDGCVTLDTGRRLSRRYIYVRLQFRSHSIPLLEGVYEMLCSLGYHPRKHAKNHQVRLNRQDEVRRYFREIGTRNEYHLGRYVKCVRKAWGEDVSAEVCFLG